MFENNVYIHVHGPWAEADNPLGSKLFINKVFYNLVICYFLLNDFPTVSPYATKIDLAVN